MTPYSVLKTLAHYSVFKTSRYWHTILSSRLHDIDTLFCLQDIDTLILLQDIDTLFCLQDIDTLPVIPLQWHRHPNPPPRIDILFCHQDIDTLFCLQDIDTLILLQDIGSPRIYLPIHIYTPVPVRWVCPSSSAVRYTSSPLFWPVLHRPDLSLGDLHLFYERWFFPLKLKQIPTISHLFFPG